MTAKAFLELVGRGNQIKEEDFGELEALHQAFPYFLIPNILASKYLYNPLSNENNPYLAHAAIRIPDRRRLRFLMENDLPFLPDLKIDGEPANVIISQLEKESVPLPLPEQAKTETLPEGAEETVVQETPADELPENESAHELSAVNPQSYNHKDILQKLEENLSKLKHTPKEDLVGEEPQKTEPAGNTLGNTGEDLIESIKRREKKAVRDEKKKQQIRIIKEFTAKNIRFKPTFDPNESYQAEDLSLTSTQLNDHMISESYAKILARQKKTQEAKEIYQKLQLKYPDKKAYFADCINKLEEK